MEVVWEERNIGDIPLKYGLGSHTFPKLVKVPATLALTVAAAAAAAAFVVVLLLLGLGLGVGF